MTPLNNSIVATRCFIFAQGFKHSGYQLLNIENVQLGWDDQTKSVWTICKCGCYRLFPTDKTFPEFETARMACRKHMADSPEYHDMAFRKIDRPTVPQGWESVEA